MPAERSPPRNHDPRNPLRCAEACEHQTGRHFEQGVAKKKQATTKAVDRCAELQIVVHLKGSEADVHPVDVGHDVGKENQWQDAPHRLSHCRSPDRTRRRSEVRSHFRDQDTVRSGRTTGTRRTDLPFGMTRYKELTGVSVDRHSPSVVRRGSRRARFFPSNTQTHRI
jgi:hypothetical protein